MKWIRGLFGKKRNTLPAIPDSTEDWCVGDLAECVANGMWWDCATGNVNPHDVGPANGEIRCVTVLDDFPFGDGGSDVQFLGFARWPGSGYAACAFRKITPHADETGAADADFVRKMKRVKA